LLTRNKSFHIILLLLLFSSIISSETRILEISNIRINPGENKIPMDGGSFLTWNNNNVSVNGVNIFESGNENIVNVIINPQKTKPEAVIITENSQNGALPKLLFTKNNLLMLLPETQHVTIFDSNGSLSGEFDLFEEISWSHEKKILTASDKNDYLFLLGMESANLTKNHNVSLFSLIENPELIINLPLSMPYFFSISSKNIYAIIGTNSKSNSITQTPVLILLDQNYKLLNQPVELKKLPKNISWFKDELILIYKDHLMIYSTDNQTSKYEIKFEQKIFPLDIITYNKSIFVISALEIGIGKNGNFYQSMVLLEYDTDFNTIAFHPLLHGSFNRVKYFPNQGNTFYLQYILFTIR